MEETTCEEAGPLVREAVRQFVRDASHRVMLGRRVLPGRSHVHLRDVPVAIGKEVGPNVVESEIVGRVRRAVEVIVSHEVRDGFGAVHVDPELFYRLSRLEYPCVGRICEI
jgi:hypothetical protein